MGMNYGGSNPMESCEERFSRCLAAGYPRAHVDYAFNGYCTKRVDQTDVTVPVGRAR